MPNYLIQELEAKDKELRNLEKKLAVLKKSPRCARCGKHMILRYVGVQPVALACPVCFTR